MSFPQKYVRDVIQEAMDSVGTCGKIEAYPLFFHAGELHEVGVHSTCFMK